MASSGELDLDNVPAGTWALWRHTRPVARAKAVWELLQQNEVAQFVDVGPGAGLLEQLAKGKADWDPLVDVPGAWPFDDGELPCLVCDTTYQEHLRDPVFLSEIRRVVSPGGLVVLGATDAPGLFRSLPGLVEEHVGGISSVTVTDLKDGITHMLIVVGGVPGETEVHLPPAGGRDYKAYVGPPQNWDKAAEQQLHLLVRLGLRQKHYLLDVGCGSLRGGRLFIPYLLRGHYFGVEPEEWLVARAIEHEIGRDMLRLKKPAFDHGADFDFSVFERDFDYILAQSLFSHATAKQVSQCLHRACQVMHHGSIFAFNYVRGRENYQGDRWAYPSFARYVPDYMGQLVEEAGLVYKEIEDPELRLWPHVVWVGAVRAWRA